MPDRNSDTESLLLVIEIMIPLHPLFFLLFLYHKNKKKDISCITLLRTLLSTRGALLRTLLSARGAARSLDKRACGTRPRRLRLSLCCSTARLGGRKRRCRTNQHSVASRSRGVSLCTVLEEPAVPGRMALRFCSPFLLLVLPHWQCLPQFRVGAGLFPPWCAWQFPAAETPAADALRPPL